MNCANRTLCCIALLLFWIRIAPADEIGPPPITSETLVGVWEGMPIPPCQWIIYRLEIARDRPSYLAFTLGSQDLVYRLVSSDVRRGRVTLRFHRLIDRRFTSAMKGGNPDLNDLVITGKGTAREVGSTFEGVLKMRFRRIDDIESTRVAFCKPPWAKNVADWAKKAEWLLENAKSHH